MEIIPIPQRIESEHAFPASEEEYPLEKQEEYMLKEHIRASIKELLHGSTTSETFISDIHKEIDVFIEALNNSRSLKIRIVPNIEPVTLFYQEVIVDSNKILVELCRIADGTYRFFVQEI